MRRSIQKWTVFLFLLGAVACILGCSASPRAGSGGGSEAAVSEGQESLSGEEMDGGADGGSSAGSMSGTASDSISGTASDSISGTASGSSIEVGRLAYSRLDAETQKTYDEILSACMQHRESVELSTRKEELLQTAYQAITCDQGGLFWVNGYTYTLRTSGDQVVGIEFSPTYLFSKEDRELYQGYVDQTVEEYFARLPEDASDYEKTKYVYEMLVYNVKYNAASKENQNVLSVFLFGESVCSGIASAAQYMLTLLDVPAMLVYGVSENEPHAWDLVYIDGEPYFMDATWGITASETAGDCSYAFLNLSSKDLADTHVIDMTFSVPECTSVDASYYVMEDRYFTVYDEAKIGAAIAACRENGRPGDIKCATQELYRQVRDAFISDQKLADYCPGITSINYMEQEELRVLTFLWK